MIDKNLKELHGVLAEQLLKRVKDPEAKASDLNVARQFLKDNGIDAVPVNDNPLAKSGEFQFELVVPENGDEPYFNYEDHIYFNPNSKDKGEVPDAIRKLFANISQATGSTLRAAQCRIAFVNQLQR